MAHIGMFINLASPEEDEEVACRIARFKKGVKTNYPHATDFDYVYGNGKTRRYQRLAEQLVQNSPSNLENTVLFATCGPSLWALQIAIGNSGVPIVCAGVADPYNTGVMMDNYFINGIISYEIQQAECLLSELTCFYSGVKHVAVIWEPQMRLAVGQLTAVWRKARQLNLAETLVRISIEQSEQDLQAAIYAFAKKYPPEESGLVVLTNVRTAVIRKQIIDAVNNNGLRAIYPNPMYVKSGGCFAYGPPTQDLYEKAGEYAGNILAKKPNCPPLYTNQRLDCYYHARLGHAIPKDVDRSYIIA